MCLQHYQLSIQRGSLRNMAAHVEKRHKNNDHTSRSVLSVELMLTMILSS